MCIEGLTICVIWPKAGLGSIPNLSSPGPYDCCLMKVSIAVDYQTQFAVTTCMYATYCTEQTVRVIADDEGKDDTLLSSFSVFQIYCCGII